MWCRNCNIETNDNICPVCSETTVEDIPVEIYWCVHCKTPIIQNVNQADKGICPLCGEKIKYLSADLRPVFPEERLLLNDTSKLWSDEERINICFRYRDKMDDKAVPPIAEYEVEIMKEALNLFNEYAMGGIELLYENFTSSSTVSVDDAVDYAYKAMFDQHILIESRQAGVDVDQLLRPEY